MRLSLGMGFAARGSRGTGMQADVLLQPGMLEGMGALPHSITIPGDVH